MKQQSIVSLPEELLDTIGSWLDVKDTCAMEMACNRFHKVLSRPICTWAYRNWLHLPLVGALPEEKLLGPEVVRSPTWPQLAFTVHGTIKWSTPCLRTR